MLMYRIQFQLSFVVVLQSTLLVGVEMSLESVSDFAELVATMPDQIDLTSCCEPPPILACGDRSIATAALNMLEV